MCQRLKNTDLCLAQAIHQSLIHCQHSSSTVVLEMGRPIVRADESGGQKRLHTPQRTLDTKRGASLFKQLLKSKHSFCRGAKRHGHSRRCWLRSFNPEAHKRTHKNSRAERSQSRGAPQFNTLQVTKGTSSPQSHQLVFPPLLTVLFNL